MNQLNSLADALKSNNEENLKASLKGLVKNYNDVKLENETVFDQLFLRSNSVDVLTLTCEALAEIAKDTINREALTKEHVVGHLLRLIESSKDKELSVQTCRALGNITYDNAEARKLIGKKGLHVLFKFLQKQKEIFPVGYGFMQNLLMDSYELQMYILELKFLELAESVLLQISKNVEENAKCCLHVLMIINIIAENMGDAWLTNSLCSIIVGILKSSTNLEISITCLEILHGQLECDEIKIFLAREGVCELIYQLVEKYKNEVKDEDSQAVLKMACDIIVLILTGDESMNFLYSNGEGACYKNMLAWLKCNNHELQSTSILALGNFARNDDHCIQIVKSGIAKDLLSLLLKHNAADNDSKLQYAILSALRNLVILPQNKPLILADGLIECLYPMMCSEHTHVIFKLLGTLRIVVDGQPKHALDLLLKPDLLDRIVFWCNNSDHIGVRGECSRLLAWLIKHCQSSKPFSTILTVDGCVKCLVEMLSSNYEVMQNEAIYALSLLCAECQKNEDRELLSKKMIEADIGRHLKFLIDKYNENMTRETLANYLTLLESLIKLPALTKHLKSIKLDETVVSLRDNPKLVEEAKKIDDLSSKLSNIAL